MVSVAELGSVHGGSTPARSVPRYWGGEIPWVTPGELTGLLTKYLTATAECITRAGLDSCGACVLPPDTLLVTSRATLGAVALIRSATATNQGFKSIVFAREAEPHYYYHLFKVLGSELERRASGTTFLEIPGREFKAIRVPRPLLSEQHLIAQILDTVDQAIRKTEQLIAKLKLVKQGLLHDLLTRGIDENGEIRDPERHPEQFKDSPVGRIPSRWDILELGEISLKITDGTHQPVRTVMPYSDAVPFLFVSCVRDGIIHWDKASFVTRKTYASISRGREPHRGMVLYTAVGSYGHAAVVWSDMEFSFQRHLACISPNPRLISSDFLGHWLSSSAITRHADRVALGNAQKTITLHELSRYPVALPGMSEQAIVADILNRIGRRLDISERELAKLRLLKAGLMDDLLTGRVRVTPLLDS